MPVRHALLVIASAWLLVAATETFAQNPSPAPAGLSSDEIATAAGNYQRYCSLCHGDDRQGHINDHAPSLRSRSLIESGYPSIIGQAIAYGRPGTAMGGYLDEVGGPLDRSQVMQLTKWLREQANVEPLEMATTPIHGDISAGASAYQRHCATCHGASGEGGTGTALGNPAMLALTTDEFLRHAIVNGRQDTPMPAFKGVLTASDIDGVIAYLGSHSGGWTIEAPVLHQPPALDDYILNPKGNAPNFGLEDGLYVKAANLDRELKARRRMVVLDTRVTSMWQRAHIQGAVPIPYYADRDTVIANLPRDGTWIVAYCECPRAAAESVVKRLRKEGFEHTAVLWEGIQGWVSMGYPVVAGDTPAVAATTSTRPGASAAR